MLFSVTEYPLVPHLQSVRPARVVDAKPMKTLEPLAPALLVLVPHRRELRVAVSPAYIWVVLGNNV